MWGVTTAECVGVTTGGDLVWGQGLSLRVAVCGDKGHPCALPCGGGHMECPHLRVGTHTAPVCPQICNRTEDLLLPSQRCPRWAVPHGDTSHVPVSPPPVMPCPVHQPMPLCVPTSYPRSQMSSTTLCSMGTGSRQRWAALAATSSSSPCTTRSSAAKRQR